MKSTDSIGGYLGLETRRGNLYHENAIAVNTGRNALEYILRVRKYKHIYLPSYTCSVLLEPIKKLGVSFEFYSLDENLEIKNLPVSTKESALLYTNYFGIKNDYADCLVNTKSNIIIDAAQSFFYKSFAEADTFYSPRKFFGVPDGGLVICRNGLQEDLEQDVSCDRFSHLLVSIDRTIEEGYATYKSNEDSLSNQRIKEMSNLTYLLLNGIDYGWVAKKRNENFFFLHKKLKAVNKLKWKNEAKINGPMVYPLFSAKPGLRKRLLESRIYLPTLWKKLPCDVANNSFEFEFSRDLLPLPIDQRYGIDEMTKIVEVIDG